MKKIDRKTILAIILLVLAISVVIISNFINKKENSDVGKITILNDYNDFYTVDSCIYRAITYIGSGDSKSLLLVINDDYKEKNKINETNVLNLFSNINETSTFKSTKMFYQKINSSLTKFFVEGYVEDFILDEYTTMEHNDKTKIYFVVYLDSENSLFSIEPYDGEIFQGGEING